MRRLRPLSLPLAALPLLPLLLAFAGAGVGAGAGCSSANAPAAAAGDASVVTPPAADRACPDVGASRCDGARVQSCEARGDATAWTDSADCPGEQTCRDTACQDPTAQQLAQATSIAALAATLSKSSAWHEPVDVTALVARERTAIVKGDGSDGVFYGAAWRTMNAFPQGHQSLLPADTTVCGKAIPYQHTSRFGVCGRPSGTGIAVTAARAGNKLGLKAGDMITSADGESGDALFTTAYLRPVCGDVFPAVSGRRYSAAASFFGTVPAGAKLAVRAADGTTRDLVIPADADAQRTDCTDPFSRNRQIYAEAKVRADGVAVIRLPSFYPFDKQLPANPTQADFDAFTASYQAEIQKVFDSVKTAPAIIWDARGNTGGITSVGLAIVNGFPSAKTADISYCRTRIAGSSPIAYDAQRYAPYAIAPGGPFAYSGKVAVVTDGLAYSAGDYFPFAVAKGSAVPIIGSASAGAYGGGRSPITIHGPPPMNANFDPTACFDAATDLPLEGSPLPPTVAVEYDVADLA
ncbi:MAG: Peptidase family, partial [Myxococcaceae bacterium]|nr:Peptidase family [Myxococcaceae bacterium]